MFFFFKAMHIVGFVAWFAGLFYLVRMFVYHVEAEAKPQPDRDILKAQLLLMEQRVFSIICNPALAITWMFGLGMLYLYGWNWILGNGSWMFTKLVLLLILSIYHFWSGSLIRKLEHGQMPFSSFQFRLLNEVPTLLLVSIVLLAVYRNTLDFARAFFGILLFGILLYIGAKLYRRQRTKNKS